MGRLQWRVRLRERRSLVSSSSAARPWSPTAGEWHRGEGRASGHRWPGGVEAEVRRGHPAVTPRVRLRPHRSGCRAGGCRRRRRSLGFRGERRGRGGLIKRGWRRRRGMCGWGCRRGVNRVAGGGAAALWKKGDPHRGGELWVATGEKRKYSILARD
jgi:hypothetical protein